MEDEHAIIEIASIIDENTSLEEVIAIVDKQTLIVYNED